MTVGRSSRTLRAAVFAVVGVLFAVQGHVMMSGVAVPGWALVAGAVLTGGMAWCLAGRERGLLLVGSLAVAGQVVLHTLFSLGQAVGAGSPEATGGASLAQRWLGHVLCSPAGPATDSHGAEPAAHAMPSMDSTHSMDGMGGMGGMDMSHAGHVMDGMSAAGMLAAHLAIALLCALWLAHGERAAFRILRVLRALAGRLVAPLRLLLRLPAPPHRPRVRARRGDSARVLRRLLLVDAITSRGPPAGTAVL